MGGEGGGGVVGVVEVGGRGGGVGVVGRLVGGGRHSNIKLSGCVCVWDLKIHNFMDPFRRTPSMNGSFLLFIPICLHIVVVHYFITFSHKYMRYI